MVGLVVGRFSTASGRRVARVVVGGVGLRTVAGGGEYRGDGEGEYGCDEFHGISGYLAGVVVVVDLSLVMVVPSGCVMLRLTVEEVVDGSLAGGVVTTVVELAGGGVVVVGTTTVVSLVTVAGPGVVVVTVRSQPVTTADPRARNAMAGMSLFMTSPFDLKSNR